MTLICKLIHDQLSISEHAINIGIVEQDMAVALARVRRHNISINASNRFELSSRVANMHMSLETTVSRWSTSIMSATCHDFERQDILRQPCYVNVSLFVGTHACYASSLLQKRYEILGIGEERA